MRLGMTNRACNGCVAGHVVAYPRSGRGATLGDGWTLDMEAACGVRQLRDGACIMTRPA